MSILVSLVRKMWLKAPEGDKLSSVSDISHFLERTFCLKLSLLGTVSVWPTVGVVNPVEYLLYKDYQYYTNTPSLQTVMCYVGNFVHTLPPTPLTQSSQQGKLFLSQNINYWEIVFDAGIREVLNSRLERLLFLTFSSPKVAFENYNYESY